MSGDAGCEERFVWVLFATMVKPISDLRLLISGLCVMLFALCFPAQAQQSGKIPRIGWITGASFAANAHRMDAFRLGLRDLGYVEGKNIIIEWRAADSNQDRQRVIVTELVNLKVDIIVASGGAPVRNAKELTTTIPIVFAQDADPIGNGFVASLARPGGNITGLSRLAPELNGKQVELLKEVVPRVSRLAVFASSSSQTNARILKDVQIAAQALRLKLKIVDVLDARAIEPAFREAIKDRTDAVLWAVGGNIASPHRRKITELAIKSRLPTIYEQAAFVEAGGLISYGVNFNDLDPRSATYFDKILKGAKPAELPVEPPTKFEFIVNLKTAKQIGLTIPPNVLARADKIIR